MNEQQANRIAEALERIADSLEALEEHCCISFGEAPAIAQIAIELAKIRERL